MPGTLENDQPLIISGTDSSIEGHRQMGRPSDGEIFRQIDAF
jgi:hypothetical protein